jgi:hypothetical protein
MSGRFGGMTVNERLYEAGLLDEFDEAARARNHAAMIRILKQVEMGDKYAALTADAILANPAKYGF